MAKISSKSEAVSQILRMNSSSKRGSKLPSYVRTSSASSGIRNIRPWIFAGNTIHASINQLYLPYVLIRLMAVETLIFLRIDISVLSHVSSMIAIGLN